MAEPVIIVPYDEAWSARYRAIGDKIRLALGETAVRIDHIGSTSVKGLDAKPVIDIQISVRELDPVEAYKGGLESIGFVYRADNPDKSKRYFRESPGCERTHIHVREHGSWSEQLNILFRDYLRSHPEDCRVYAAAKIRLTEMYRNERTMYVDGKSPVVWHILQKANVWSQETGWRMGKSDC